MRKNIALVTGGYSGESVISYKSAFAILENLDKSKWDCFFIDINSQGWFYKPSDDVCIEVDKNDFSVLVDHKKIFFDAALIALHGTPGEDGKLQGYFDCLGIRYTSCDASTSALTFNKRYTVAVSAFAGISVANSVHLFKHTPVSKDDILQKLSLPVFVKPNNGGSSLGISKVTHSRDLADAIEKAFLEDNQILIEEFISGREFTVGVFKSKGEITVLPITEIKTQNEFFDFEAKYSGASEEITPADIDENIAEKIRKEAVKAYEAFNCRGIVRIDFIYNHEKSIPYLLEINSVPGQSEASIIPQQIKAMGWNLKDFYSLLIEECFL